MHCMNYVGVVCINGCCPNALADEFPEYGMNIVIVKNVVITKGVMIVHYMGQNIVIQ